MDIRCPPRRTHGVAAAAGLRVVHAGPGHQIGGPRAGAGGEFPEQLGALRQVAREGRAVEQPRPDVLVQPAGGHVVVDVVPGQEGRECRHVGQDQELVRPGGVDGLEDGGEEGQDVVGVLGAEQDERAGPAAEGAAASERVGDGAGEIRVAGHAGVAQRGELAEHVGHHREDGGVAHIGGGDGYV